MPKHEDNKVTKQVSQVNLFNTGPVAEFLDISSKEPDFLFSVLESASSGFGAFLPKERAYSSHDVIARGLDRFLHSLRLGFPKLTEEAWWIALKIAWGRTELPLDEVFFVWSRTQIIHLEETNEKLEDILPLQTIGIAMVVEHYWSTTPSNRNLRESISLVSGRPEFLAFKGDAEPYEFWNVSNFNWLEIGEVADMQLSHSIQRECSYKAILTIQRSRGGFSAKGLEELRRYTGNPISNYGRQPIQDAILAGSKVFLSECEQL